MRFRVGEKIRTKVDVDVSRGYERRVSEIFAPRRGQMTYLGEGFA